MSTDTEQDKTGTQAGLAGQAGQGGLSDDERAELEALRAQKRAQEEALQAAREREELEQLRKQQAQQREDLAYYRQKEEKRRQREHERANPDYSLDDLEPMPVKQKIVIAVLAVMTVLMIAYLIWFNLH